MANGLSLDDRCQWSMVDGRLVWIRDCTLLIMYALPIAYTSCDGEKCELYITLELEKLGVYVSSKMNHNTKFDQLNKDYAITAQIKFVRKLIPGVASYVVDMAQNQEFAFTKSKKIRAATA